MSAPAASKTPRKIRRPLTLASLALACSWAHAQQAAPPPNAGTLLQQQRDIVVPPPTSRDDTEQSTAPAIDRSTDNTPIPIQTIEFDGATRIPREELAAFTKPYLGRSVTLGELQNLLSLVGEAYRRKGYGFSYAYLPKQDVTNGTVHIAIAEGRAGQIHLVNHTQVRDATLKSSLQRFRNDPSHTVALERGILLMSDIPGVGSVVPAVTRGGVPGTVDMTVTALPSPLVSGSLTADNNGPESAGRYRLTAGLDLSNPLGVGDRLRFSLSGLPGNLLNGARTTVAGGSYDFPLLDALRIGGGYNYLSYRLGGDFEGLGSGSAEVGSMYAQYALVRQRRYGLFLTSTYENKRLSDNQGSFLHDDRTTHAVTLGITGYVADTAFGSSGFTQYTLTGTAGRLHFRDDLAKFLDQEGPHTRGAYSKINWSVQHQRQITPILSLSADIQAQWAQDNLDSAERMVLTGPDQVRAFSPDFLSVDTGVLGRVRLSIAPPRLRGLSASVYYDAGTGILRRSPQAGDRNNANVQGVGVGLGYQSSRWLASLTVATRTGGNAPGLDTQAKSWTWATVSYRF